MIFTYIWVILKVNVDKYSIHGAYGFGLFFSIRLRHIRLRAWVGLQVDEHVARMLWLGMQSLLWPFLLEVSMDGNVSRQSRHVPIWNYHIFIYVYIIYIYIYVCMWLFMFILTFCPSSTPKKNSNFGAYAIRGWCGYLAILQDGPSCHFGCSQVMFWKITEVSEVWARLNKEISH